MRKFIIVVLLIFSAKQMLAQKMYSVDYENQADISVFVVDYANQADLKVIACLKKYDKVDWFERYISTLSQGQKHLVCLLSVLLMKPRVLLLDEPFTGIDIPTQRKLEQYLGSLEQTIIHVSHVPETFENYQRLIWMDEGVVKADGKPKTVIKKYKDAMENYVEINV